MGKIMHKIIAVLLWFNASYALALTNMLTFGNSFPQLYNSASQSLMVVKGSTDNNFYILEADPTTGALPVSIAPSVHGISAKARYDYTVPVTTAAYTELIASTANAITTLNIFDSSGETIILAVGNSGSEIDYLYIPPGGFNAPMNISITAGTRLSIKALSANATSGELVLNATD